MSARDTLINIVIRAKDQGSRAVSGFANRLNSLDNTVTRVAASIGAFLGARALINWFTDATRGAASFEEQMSKVEAVSGASAEEMARLTEEAKRLGRETVFTATQAGEGLEVLARAGLDATQQIAALGPVLNTAQAEGIGLAEAAGYVTDTLSIYNLEADKSAQVSDLFAKGASIANTSIADLGQAIRESGGLARASNLTLGETVAVLDQLANNGLRGSKAGTGLKSILAQLADPASTARKELSKLGINTGDLSKVILGLEKSGERGKQAMLAFGTEALPAIQALTNGGSTAIAGFTAKLDEAEGAAAKMAKTATNNLSGALKGMGSAWDGIKQKLTALSLPVFTQQVKDLTVYFQTLAADGSVDRFGAALAKAFKEGGERLKTFLADFDFTEALGKASAFVDGLVANFERGYHSLGALTASVRLAVNVFTSGIKAIAGGITFFFADAAGSIADFLGFIGATDWEAKAREIRAGLAGVSEEFKKGVIEDRKDLENAWGDLQNHLTGISENASSRRVKVARDEAKAIVESAEDAATALQGVQDELGSAGEYGAQVATALGESFAESLDKINNGADLAQFRADLSEAWADGSLAADDYVALVDKAKQRTEAFGSSKNAVKAVGAEWGSLADAMKAAREERTKAREEQKAQDAENAAEKTRLQDIGSEYDALAARIGSADTRGKIIDLRSDLVSAFKDGKIALEEFNASMDGLDNQLDEVKSKTRSFKVTLAGETADAFRQMSEQMQVYSEKLFDSIKGTGKRLVDQWWAAEHAMRETLSVYKEQEVEVNRLAAALQQTDNVTESMLNTTEQAAAKFDLLGDEQLAPLRNAISAARREIESLNTSAAGTLSALRDELDSLNNDYEAIEGRDYQARRAELMALIAEAQRSGASDALQQAQEALTVLEQVHTKKMNNLRAEKAESDRLKTQEQQSSRARQNQPDSASQSSKTVRLVLGTAGGEEVAASLDSEADVDKILKLLQNAGLSSL